MSERPSHSDTTGSGEQDGHVHPAASLVGDRMDADRQRLLTEVEAERRRLADIFQYAPSFMAVLRGSHHVFERVNDRFIELIGGRDVVGLTAREAFPEVEGQGYFELLDQVYQKGKPHVAADAPLTLGLPPMSRDLWVQFVYQPMFDAEGVVTGVFVQGIDLTERRQAEATIARVTAESQRQRRIYETALSNTADFIYLFDLEGRFIYVNKALLDLWGTELSQVVGRTFSELDYPPELATRLHQQIQEVVKTRKPLRDETVYTSRLGTAVYEYIFVPALRADGTVEAVAGSTREITDRKLTEDALRESEKRYRALVDTTSDVVYRMSSDWTAMQSLDGRELIASKSEPITNWMERNLPDFEHGRVKAAINAAIAGKKPFELEHQVIRADGSLGWTFSRAVPIQDDEGNLVEWFGTASDVTRRKLAEEDLRDIRSRMDAALSAGAIGTWSWNVVEDRFYGDSSTARIFSVKPEDVAGGPLDRFVEAIHPDDRDRVMKLVTAALENGTYYEASYRVVQPDRSLKWVTARGQVERDAYGNPVRFPGVVIDVTDWKRAEESLAMVMEESERRKRLYETILSNTPDLAYVFDLDHKFMYVNEGLLKMWGRTWNEAIGKTCLELGYEPWHAEMHAREIDEIKVTRKPLRGEVPFRGTFGRRIYDYIMVPVLGANGEVEAVAGTTRDITERKEAEEALRNADRQKDDFIALLAHELRNPLAPIRTGLEVIRLTDQQGLLADARTMMERQLGHMIRLIDDLLDISRISRNKMELRLSRVSIADVISNAVETSLPLIREAAHEFVVSMPDEEVFLHADLTRLSQVFSNLLTNSAKYTEPGGKIWLTVQIVDAAVVVTVRDTGCGIPVESLSTVFEMFSQVNRSLERSTGGLGIGLALVKALVEMHQGTVTGHSEGLGKGSTFVVTLPGIERPSKVNVSAPPPGNVPTVFQGQRVIIVDDNRDAAMSLAMMLKLMGSEVVTANDGIQAIHLAETYRPHLILMDVGMPYMNGLDATAKIRSQSWGKAITIIALTGWGHDEDRERSQQMGCNGHLTKPIDIEKLTAMLRQIQARSR